MVHVSLNLNSKNGTAPVLFLALALLVACGFTDRARSDDSSAARQPVSSVDDSRFTVPAGSDRSGQTTDQAPPDSYSPRWKRDTIATTDGAGYLTEIERRVIMAINMVRADPAAYARRYLAPLRSHYHDGLLRFPGEIDILTTEGVRALDECIRELQSAKPVSPLSPKMGLTRAARDHARDQALTGATGHAGSDGSTMEARIKRYGTCDIAAGENIGYGNEDAGRIVTALLIDDGVASRGHRRNLLNGTFRFVGVSVGPHPVYGHMCVMDFAGFYR